VPAHGDEPVRPEKGNLEWSLPDDGGGVGDSGELVDQRYDGADGPPAVQMGGGDDAGERVNDHDVEAGRIEGAPEARRGLGLLRRFSAAGHHHLHLHAVLLQTIQETPVVQVTAGETSRVPDRDEGDSQGQSRAPSRAA